MVVGCFNGFRFSRQPPLPGDDATVSPAFASTRATQPSSDSLSGNGGVCDVTAIEIIPPGPISTDIPTPVSTQGFLPSSAGILTPAVTEAQHTGPHSAKGNADTPVPAHSTEVFSASAPSRATYRLDPAEANKHINRISRFRVLVMGRANAGKTTILQRVCNTTDQPEIFNGEGQKVDVNVVQGSLTRGHHNIEDELVFQSNPGFVFHDSCGFEAGSEDQFDMMKGFVTDRAKTTKLVKRIHAIWFCVPLTDTHRMVTASELKFFNECDTGYVPVILLATKADTLELEAIQKLEDQGLGIDSARARAADLQQEILNNNIIKLKDWLKRTKFPPHDYLALTGMQKEGAECQTLLSCTANALREEGLQQLLISTQQSNLGLCIEFAIMKTLKKWMNEQVDKIGPTSLALSLSRWFPYKYYYQIGGDLGDFAINLSQIQDRDFGLDLVVQDVGQRDGLPLHGDLGGPQDKQLGSQKFDLRRIFKQNHQSVDITQLKQLVHHLHGEGQGVGSQKLKQAVDDDLVPAIYHTCPTLRMPTLSTSRKHSMESIAEHGIGCLLVFEYLYFWLQGSKARNDLQKNLTWAVEEYQTSGTQDKVHECIKAAFKQHGDSVDVLCPTLMEIAKKYQMSKKLNGDG